MRIKQILSLFVILFLASCASKRVVTDEGSQQPKREFRGAWIQAVNGQFTGKSEKEMKRYLIEMLDNLQRVNVNAVIFQVRVEGDALYESRLEPWSRYLTGKQGRSPGWDPLAFMVEECHKRNMELHAWINPYRARTKGTKAVASNHMSAKKPDNFIEYDGQLYFNPALQSNRTHICNVVKDILVRYDVDGIHMDDYFYPYPVSGQDFPDAEAYAKDSRGFDNIGDWRRDNVNLAIEQVHNTINSIKPHVQFGISPFGIWRNKVNDPRGSETNGLQNYDQLYADILLWMEKGWIDYVVPQLYWEIGKKVADYEILAHWWAQHATDKCRVYIGMAPYHLGNPKAAAAWNEGNEICRQLRLNRTIEGITGECYFPANVLLKNHHNVADSLKQVFYPTYVSAPRK